MPRVWRIGSVKQNSVRALWRTAGSWFLPAIARNARMLRALIDLHFPRTDAAIIVIVEYEGACLLGRQAGWPPGRYSTLAGFVEPGEALEDAVRREVAEESGVIVGDVHYHSSQPWPMPASLMIGFTATAVTPTISLRDGELEDARWFTPQQIVDGLATRRLAHRPGYPCPISCCRTGCGSARGWSWIPWCRAKRHSPLYNAGTYWSRRFMAIRLLAALIALGLLHLQPQLAHWRGDGGFRRLVNQLADTSGWARVLVAVLVPVLLCALVVWLFSKLPLADLLQLLFALVILLFSFGPHAFEADLEAVLKAPDQASREAAAQQLCDEGQFVAWHATDLGEATAYAALRRRFGVLLWFFLLGPVGALLYRLARQLGRDASLNLDTSTRTSAHYLANALDWLPPS